MTHSEGTLTSRDGTELFFQHWSVEGPTKAVLCLVHGLGEHSGRYAAVAQRFNEAGYALIAFDTRGHGRSPGTRGHTPFDRTMEDVSALLDRAAELYPGLPRFLYGHSLGGLIVLTHGIRLHPEVTGIVATSSGLSSPLLDQKLKIGAAKLLGSLLPTMTVPTGLDANLISRDPEVVRVYLADPLVHDRSSLALGRDGALAAEHALAHADEIDVPLLLVHGTGDGITYAHGSQDFAAKATGDKALHLYDGLFHETHNEPEREQVLGETIAWLDAHVA
ncbi:MAG TPA: alpha/beta hydrolase [Candidatus Nanopelagicales bacterium]|nr:alpha/beta hydrolase [Candidatus Nanopelagicales bacterium]